MSNKIAQLSNAQSFSAIQSSLGHLNNMNGVSYDINNPLLKLRVVASSCFFGEPSYYSEASHSSKEKNLSHSSDYNYLKSVLQQAPCFDFEFKGGMKTLLESHIDLALSYDARATLQEAVRLRHEDNIRTTPQIIMVRAANHEAVRGTGLIREFGNKIMARADEPAVQLAYQLSAFGREKIPNALKKAWKSFIEKQSELQLAKYRMDNHKVKTLDVVNLCHAKGEEVDKLMRGQLKLSTEDTWEALISKNGSDTENWSKAVDLMGHMALLRNLRNFKSKSVNMSPVYSKLIETAAKGKQLPFRYYSAAKALSSAGQLTTVDKVALSKCLELSMSEMPKFNGRVMSLCDNSGSAHNTMTSEFGTVKVSEIANLSAILTAKNSDEGYVGVFGDKLNVSKVSKNDDVFVEMEKCKEIAYTIGQSTENGIWLFFDNAIKKKEHWDHIFVYSDMQAGHGGLYGTNHKEYSNYLWRNGRHIDVAKLIKDYREKVNPNVHVYLVQVAGYGDSLVPEFYNKTYILGGWSSSLFKFAHKMQEINNLLDNHVNVPVSKNTVAEKPVLNVAKNKDLSSERPKKRSK